MEELQPWVTSKSFEESEFQRIQKEQIESENCYGLYKQQQEDGGALSLGDKLLETGGVYHNTTLESNNDKPSPIPSELLMNSALSAVNDINKDECPGEWYKTDSITPRTYSAHSNKLLLRRETSRSESSLHNDSYSSDTSDTSDSIKEFQSDSATLDHHQTIKGSGFFSHKRQPVHPRKGHYRSKSDQIGMQSNMINQIDIELSLPGVSKSLPKDTTGNIETIPLLLLYCLIETMICH